MAISHKDHDHPNTPAARAACRKAMIRSDQAYCETLGPPLKPAQMTVVPRKRGDGGVVKGMKATTPKTATKQLKRSNSLIKAEYDLVDVPRMLAYGVRMAWALDLDARAGDPFTEDEARIVIQHNLAEIALVWKVTNPEGLHAIFVRNWDSSVTFKMSSVQQAFEVAADHDAWDEFGNLINP